MMFAEFTELITGGIQQGQRRQIVVNLEKVITFRGVPNSGGCLLETRRGDIHVEATYDDVKNLFNNKNGMAPVLMPKESWTENISIPVVES